MSRIDTSKEQIVHDGRLYPLSPVKSFEVGKWYVYTETVTTEPWATSMKVVLDCEPRRCTSSDGTYLAIFGGVPGGWWTWKYGFENWREVFGYPKAEATDEAKEPDGWQLGAWYRAGMDADGDIFQIVEIDDAGEGYKDRFPNNGIFSPYKLEPYHQLLHSPTPIGERPEGLDGATPVGSSSPSYGHLHIDVREGSTAELGRCIHGDVMPTYNGKKFSEIFYDAMRAAPHVDTASGKTEVLSGPSSIEDRARSMLRDL